MSISDGTSSAEELVEEGLRLYSRGQLDDALFRWRLALQREPELRRAQEYIQYVESNRGALEQTFAAARAMVGRSGTRSGQQAVGPSPAAASDEPREGRSSKVRRGGAAQDNLLDETGRNQGRGRERHRTPQHLSRAFDDEDLTPRIDLTAQANLTRSDVEGGKAPSPPLAGGSRAQRVRMPMAKEEAAGDFDAPEPTTGKLGSAASIELASPTPGHLTPRPALGDDPNEGLNLYTASVTPATMGTRANAVSQSSRYDEAAETNGDFSGEQVTSNVLGRQEQAPPTLPPRPPPLPLDGLEEDIFFDDDPTPVAPSRSTLPLGAESPAQLARAELDLGSVSGEADEEADEAVDEEEAGVRGAVAGHGAGEEGVEDMIEGARQLFEQGTFEGSLWLCERALAKESANRDARGLLERNQQVLLRQYQQKLADLGQVPVVRIPQQEIIWHKLDHRAGFLLSRVDGVLSYGDILDISGMSNFEAYRILAQLLDQGVIGSAP